VLIAHTLEHHLEVIDGRAARFHAGAEFRVTLGAPEIAREIVASEARVRSETLTPPPIPVEVDE
jgi:hypothetical protein